MDAIKNRAKVHNQEKEDFSLKGFIEKDMYVENVSVGKYIIIKELGHGSTAKVFLAFNKSSKKRVAIKVVERKHQSRIIKNDTDSIIGIQSTTTNIDTQSDVNGFTDTRIYREIIMSTLLDHPHIAKLLEFFYSETHFFLVFEYVKGRQLYDEILQNSKIPEDKVRKYFRQVVSAVDYIHKNCIAHRDLKIENIIIDTNDNIKILDFGLSNFFDQKRFLKTFCGSLYFAAPELLNGQTYSGPEVDIWSLGVILYVMLCGKVPFDDDSVKELQRKIKSAEYVITKDVSVEAKELLDNMMVHDASKRYTIEDIKSCTWINLGYKNPIENYLSKRFPIINVNEEFVKALSEAIKFQYPSACEDIMQYKKYCNEQGSRIDIAYWNRFPVISLYYLLVENINLYSKKSINEIKFLSSDLDAPEVLHRFVKFIFPTTNINRPLKHYYEGVFEDISSAIDESDEKCAIQHPKIKKSYVRGLINGIKVRQLGSSSSVKKIIINTLLKYKISFEIDENAYYCSFRFNEEEVYFKISIFYNVILSNFYITLKCLNNKTDGFSTVSQLIQKSLKY